MLSTSTTPFARRFRRASLIALYSLGLTVALIVPPSSVLLAAPQTAIVERALTIALDQPAPVSPNVTVGRFNNGVRYFIRENEEPENRAELRLVVEVGSVLEDEDQVGLAHFLEHMAFNGTENFEKKEILDFMESIGMPLGPGANAYTGFDETVYELTLPTDSAEVMATAFQILEDWATVLTLDSDEIDLERGVVIEEWRRGQGAQTRIRDQYFPILLRDSRYANRLPIGTLENLENFDAESLRRFYRDWYRPELMAVIAVGDFNATEIENRIREHFEDLPVSTDPRERTRYEVPSHDETLFTIATDPELQFTQVAVYHKMPPENDWTIGGYRQRIVERLYNSMLSARFQEISREPNSPFLGAGSQRSQLVRTAGSYELGALVTEENIGRGLQSLLVEAERVARFGFTPAELERQKIAVLRGMERLYTNRESRSSRAFAAEYIRAYLDGESIPGVEYEYALYQRFVPEITVEEINRVGDGWISDTNRVVLVTAPEKKDLIIPGEADLIEVLAEVAEVEIAPYEDDTPNQPLLAQVPSGSPVVATRSLDQGITEWNLENGIKVVLMPTDFREDEIVFRGFSTGGISLASDEDFIPASTSVTVVANGGLGAFDAIDLQRELTGKVANVSPFISEFGEGVSGSASPMDLETMFQLIYLRFTAPRADETFFEIYKTQMQSILENRDVNPATAFGDAYNRIMTQDHLRRRPQTVEMLDGTDLAKSIAFYEDRFADAGDFTFVFVGNMDLDVMRPLVETYVGALPTTDREETWQDVGIRPPIGVFEETVNRGIEPVSQTRITFTGPAEYGLQSERVGIRAMAMVAETRMFDRMREELGGTYGVSVRSGLNWRPEETYSLTISFGSDPERAAEMVETVFAEIEMLQESPPSDSEVSDTREALLRSFETDFQSNRTWMSQLVNDYERGVEPGASVLSYTSTVEDLTPEAIQAAAIRFFNTDNYVHVTLMPEE